MDTNSTCRQKYAFLESDQPSFYRDFRNGIWQHEIDVRDFIQKNYTPYTGDAYFLTEATDRTQLLWQQVMNLMGEEQKKGVLDIRQAQVDAGIPAAEAYSLTMYIMAGLLLIGFLCNLAIKEVDDKHHIPEAASSPSKVSEKVKELLHT